MVLLYNANCVIINTDETLIFRSIQDKSMQQVVTVNINAVFFKEVGGIDDFVYLVNKR